MAQGQETATLYLRGIPRTLVREAKAEAARRGVSLTALAREALARALGKGGRDDEGIRSIRPDLEWFQANRKRLARRYRNEYIAIINRRVVDHDRDFGSLAMRVFAKYGYRSIAIPLVTAEEPVAHIRSPRVAAP